ncbi:hypothetical protein MNR02_06460 [Shinella sp. H4-D48]|uniref:hypothetical protein n=1 Tax=Shinella sp. H4-D48 TaxID=2925841 RepID=UPI001F538D1A|nr:hypothetical protein [Shinella sp. H4-D48]UNK39343.1 hypothetical protein MNR02_06460 [Shinella sp. H4-D48]
MTAFSMEYDFDEFELCPGIFAAGTATFVEDGDGEFYVSQIVIGGKRFTRNGYGSERFFTTTNKNIFLLIADHFENDARAQLAFAEALADGSGGNPDRAFDVRRDEQMAEAH